MFKITDKPVSLFQQLFLEAPEDDAPPDVEAAPDATAEEAPPAEETADAGPPDMEAGTDDLPPDMEGGEDAGMFGDDSGEAPSGEGEPKESFTVSEKISNIMNRGLFQKFISLLNTIDLQVSTIKNSSDVLFSLTEDSVAIMKGLEKLNENIRLYLSNQFEEENYSNNLFFFNKCTNLLMLLNENLDKAVSSSVARGGGETSK